MTSQLGYDRTRPVVVPQTQYGQNEFEYDMVDIDYNVSAEDMLRRHVGHATMLGCNVLAELSQEVADKAFREISYRAPEE